MSIKRTIITGIVALATLAAVVAPVAAQTPTVAQLMQEISALQAQLQSLSGSTTTSTTSGSLPAACVGVTFARNLVVGSTGSDVKCLQVILNQSASTKVSATGAGSPGYETSTFGPKTLVAVKIWQANAGFTPANQIGPMSRAKLNAWLGGTSSTTTTTTTTTGNNNTTPPPASGSISATLSSDTPASGALIGGQATADLLHINFTGTGSVTSVTLQRSGISDQNLFTNVYLYDGNTRITDGYSFNVSGQLVMNGLSIAVNGSHIISVRGDVVALASLTEGSSVVTLTGYTGNGSTMTSNVMGNMMSVVSGTLASVVLGADTVYGGGTQQSINAGTSQYTFWSSPIQVNTRAVILKTASFKMVGSAPTNALSNIHLFVDGIDTGKVATVTAINGSNYAMFDLTSAPITLTTGSHTVDVRADVQAGTDRTIQLSLQLASDLTITDPQVGVNIAAVGPLSGSTSFATNSGVNVLISTGSTTVNVDPTFTSQTNVSGGATNAVIGRYIIHSYGEDVKVSSLTVQPAITSLASTTTTVNLTAATTQTLTVASTSGFVAGNTVKLTTNNILGTVGTVSSTTSMSVTFASAPTPEADTITVQAEGLNNVTLYFNGSQVGTQQNWTTAALVFQLGSQVIAPAGQDSTLEVRADLQDKNDSAYGAGIITVDLQSGSTANAQGQSSQNTVFVPGTTAASDAQTNGLSIQTGNLQVAANTNFLAQAASPNSTGVKIGSFVVQNQSTSESVRLTTLTVGLEQSDSTVLTSATSPVISNFSALRTSDTTGSGSTPIQPTGTNSFSVNDTLAEGASMTIDIFANTGSDSTHAFKTTLTVASIGSVDNISSAGTLATSAVLTLGNGAVAVPTIVSSTTTPVQYIASAYPTGAQNSAQATYNFVSTSGNSTITEMKFVIYDTGTSGNSVTKICIGSVCAQPIGGTADLTGLSLVVPNGGGGLTQNVLVSYSGVGTGGLLPSTYSNIGLTYIKATSGGSTIALCRSGDTCTAGDNTLGASGVLAFGSSTTAGIVLVGSVPTVSVNTTPVSGLTYSGAVQKIGEVTVTAGTTGNIKVNTLTFSIGSSGFTTGVILSSPFLVNGTSGSTAIASITCTGSSPTVTCATNGTQTNPTLYGNDWTVTAGSSQIFSLYAGVSGTLVTNGTTWGITSSLTPAGFKWDDTSKNGTGGTASDDQLTGTLIYGFPSGAYSVHN